MLGRSELLRAIAYSLLEAFLLWRLLVAIWVQASGQEVAQAEGYSALPSSVLQKESKGFR
ncbi:MAG: hypothetical protein M3O09_14765 [Acidobacteriota bacterium]|nr:hypothetical protein [Acidobacteriota bacterium]